MLTRMEVIRRGFGISVLRQGVLAVSRLTKEQGVHLTL